MRYLDFAACAERAKIRSRMREVRLDNEFGDDSEGRTSPGARPVARSTDVRTRWYSGASRLGAAFIGVGRIRGVASSRVCLVGCGKVGFFGEERILALEESLPSLSVRIGTGVPRSDADLAT
jgi:hypothetical protein